MPQEQMQHGTRFRLCISRTMVLGLLSLLLTQPAWALPAAFPRAEGFGTDTIGGRGGQVIYVTNTNDSGAGSLRAALMTKVPRIIMFKVGGIIHLDSPIRLNSSHSFFTLAGQTATGDGIQIEGHPLNLWNGVHDVVIRYMRWRAGREEYDECAPDCTQNGFTNFGMWDNRQGQVYNVVIDHCSIYWGIDKNAAWGDIDKVTWSWNIFAEGDGSGIPGDPSNGGALLIGTHSDGKTRHFTVHHNLMANNADRHPMIGSSSKKIQTSPPVNIVDFRNNIIYNVRNNNGTKVEHGSAVNLVNNYWKRGADTTTRNSQNIVTNQAQLYLENNWDSQNCPAGCSIDNEWDIGFYDYTGAVFVDPASESAFRSSTEFSAPAITETPTSQLLSVLSQKVGANFPSRDALDQRIIEEVNTGTGEVGPSSSHPTLASGTAPNDTDGDGMPDNWENTHSLDPNDASDGSKVQGGPGYTNVEVYINFLAGDVTPPTVDTKAPAPPRYVTIK